MPNRHFFYAIIIEYIPYLWYTYQKTNREVDNLETNENLTEKLKIIGLDLENIPDKLYSFGSINFRVHKNYNEKNYKIYRYVNVNDI